MIGVGVPSQTLGPPPISFSASGSALRLVIASATVSPTVLLRSLGMIFLNADVLSSCAILWPVAERIRKNYLAPVLHELAGGAQAAGGLLERDDFTCIRRCHCEGLYTKATQGSTCMPWCWIASHSA